MKDQNPWESKAAPKYWWNKTFKSKTFAIIYKNKAIKCILLTKEKLRLDIHPTECPMKISSKTQKIRGKQNSQLCSTEAKKCTKIPSE